MYHSKSPTEFKNIKPYKTKAGLDQALHWGFLNF